MLIPQSKRLRSTDVPPSWHRPRKHHHTTHEILVPISQWNSPRVGAERLPVGKSEVGSEQRVMNSEQATVQCQPLEGGLYLATNPASTLGGVSSPQ
jgi:hypothetical protein